MAYSVSIAPLAASAVIGATTNFTATTSGAAAEGTETFVWTVNGVKQSSVTAAMNYVAAGPAGSKTVKVVATVTPAEGEAETAEAETTLTVQNKTMPAITLTLSPTSVSKEIGQSQVVTADVTGAPSGASIAYVWKRGSSVISGQTGKTITLTESAETSYTLNCEVTVSAPDYNNGTATKGIAVAFTKKTMSGVSVTLTPSSITAEKGAEASFKADVTGAPAGASVAYSWTKDGSPVEGSTSTLEIDTSTIGSQVIEVSAVVSAPDYKPVTVTKTGNVTITKRVAPEPDGELPYIHPLPFRGTAYIWCGWWVMDEIQRMTVEGKDWKLDDPDSDYYLHRYTLAKMLDDYPEVDVQESRNGYIVHRTALEAGIIYP
ncbi:Hoc-like head decoration [Klebsiella phage vB_KpnM_KpV477]|uniref:Highly immunogenic outer capsid protein n=1 Tax=Klebsiella phage vB_KpnM_KpV477 TaxID=1852625 RepID=A0A1B1P974_9CAUD|nr:Hoc-like head decoration [Klebsiella phage vB_KpnM_KpV477]ANT40630.1 putative head outer capsid protein [Klebsiella phage vB_KpnM_KpV477]